MCVEVQKELAAKLQDYFARNNYRRIDAYLPFDHFNCACGSWANLL